MLALTHLGDEEKFQGHLEVKKEKQTKLAENDGTEELRYFQTKCFSVDFDALEYVILARVYGRRALFGGRVGRQTAFAGERDVSTVLNQPL